MTIRNLDAGTKARLRLRAAQHQRSMEEEARRILEAALEAAPTPVNLADAVRARFSRVGGVTLELPPREPMREPPRPRR